MKLYLHFIPVAACLGMWLAGTGEAHAKRPAPVAVFPYEFRTIDAYGNNPYYPELGTPHVPLRRLTNPAYADGRDEPSGRYRPNPRAISNAVHDQGDTSIPNSAGISDIFWAWGQFVDHDIGLTEPEAPFEPFDIPVPAGDPYFDPNNTGNEVIPLNRSVHEFDKNGIRQQLNEITSFLDGSQVYGSDSVRARALRTLDGTGRLKTSAGNLLPFNTLGLPNGGGTDPSLFLAGDVRVNENVVLTCMHTLFVREHNLWCDLLESACDYLDGEQVYQLARAIVVAEMQSITYNEFLPLLLGPNALPPYNGYSPRVNPEEINEFATASYRFGHSMLSPTLQRYGCCGKPFAEGNLPLRDAFFNPQIIVDHGIEPLLRGAVRQVAQTVDVYIADGVRNFLFGTPGQGGFDLVSLNIQRGRDHGLANYNRVRAELGLGAVRSFSEITSDPAVQARLASIFPTVNEIDLWTGGIAEDAVSCALVGPTIRTILSEQFRRLRDGDRFWYTSYLPPLMVWLVERRGLSEILRQNTDIRFWEVPRNAFLAEPPRPGPRQHDTIARRLLETECITAARELVDYYLRTRR